ncbi:MAG: DNA mismatch repair protein MutS [Candidatus Rokubacteria bacterium]|nr:DNA mismatch repair protein MutS [Candidatus Rokubacteria bacterium]
MGEAPLATPPELTPVMRQYRELKLRYPDYLLLFRLGDFYEMFFEDAHLGARLLQIALTSRQRGEGAIPMAGIPHHAADSYIARLIAAGQKVAVCEQMEAPGKGRKLIRREVVRVITPGTVTDTRFLEGATNNFLLALARGRDGIGMALVDVSTSDFWVGEEPGEGIGLLEAALLRRPAEILVPAALHEDRHLLERLKESGAALTTTGVALPSLSASREILCGQFKVPTLHAFGLGGMRWGIQAGAAALAYLRDTQGESLGHLTRLQRFVPADALLLDPSAVSHLELFETLQERRTAGSLFAALNKTRTAMGARGLRQWLLRPLLDLGEIGRRQDAMAALVEAPAIRAEIRALLGAVGDLERLTSRVALGVAHARDLIALRNCLAPLPRLKAAVSGLAAPLLGALAEEMAELQPIQKLLADALEDAPPLGLREGGLIRESWSQALADLKRESREAKAWIAGLEARERERTGIATLRVRFNRVFGYSIEVSNANLSRIPAEYARRQTLVGAERFVTPELKEYEAKVLGAEERINRLEFELFEEVRAGVARETPALLGTARALGAVDVLAALAEVAHVQGHVRPVVSDSRELQIVDGRHPVLEAIGEQPVVPNDLELDGEEGQIIILTGPNMAGKSVYLRQAALIVILAQLGAFVPAREARIGLVDRIFARVGAQDNLARGQSTFLVEMLETANILHNVTPRSLVLLDEVGRGTSTFDGLAIAWAVAEELHEQARGAKVLFATHYHELTQLAERLPRVRNFHVAVREWNDEIIFLHKVRPGGTDRSYGIQVARLAGLSSVVIERAKTLLAELEASRQSLGPLADAASQGQLALFPPASHPVLTELAAVDLSGLTPLQALNLVARWQTHLREGPRR